MKWKEREMCNLDRNIGNEIDHRKKRNHVGPTALRPDLAPPLFLQPIYDWQTSVPTIPNNIIEYNNKHNVILYCRIIA